MEKGTPHCRLARVKHWSLPEACGRQLPLWLVAPLWDSISKTCSGLSWP
jgi:hypothetical protein